MYLDSNSFYSNLLSTKVYIMQLKHLVLFSHQSKMIRIGLFFALILAGASAQYLGAPPAVANLRQGLNI